jgi:hypothetical protein
MPHPGLGKRKKAKPRDRGPKGQNLRVVKAKSNRGRRVLESREPKLVSCHGHCVGARPRARDATTAI